MWKSVKYDEKRFFISIQKPFLFSRYLMFCHAFFSLEDKWLDFMTSERNQTINQNTSMYNISEGKDKQ